MLTLFSTPKPFRGHFGLIQSNAIESWRRLDPEIEVILFGTDEGTTEISQRLGLRHVPSVALNEAGTPLLSDMFSQASVLARHSVVCYANADIIFMPDFLDALRNVGAWRARFLLVGRRCDVDVTELINFQDAEWAAGLRRRARQDGVYRDAGWIDYFAFSKEAMPSMQPFAVGRPGWDNWLLWNSRHRGIPVVDATEQVLVVHQNHDYSHHAGGRVGQSTGVEAKQNQALIGTWARMFTIADANYRLTSRGVRRNLSAAYASRRVEIARRRLIDWSRPLRRRLGFRALNPTQPTVQSLDSTKHE